jgi:hypothetical protein
MKLKQLQEARYHKSPAIELIEQALQGNYTHSEEMIEGHDMSAHEFNNMSEVQQAVRDIADRYGPCVWGDVSPDGDGTYIWEIEGHDVEVRTDPYMVLMIHK